MNRIFFMLLFLFISIINTHASIPKEQLKAFIDKPYTLGQKDKNIPVWEVLDENKKLHSYIFESYDYAQIAGFGGDKINLLVQIDLEGKFLDVLILEQYEPVFVSGLGVEPFVEFLTQYKGKSLKDSIKVRAKRGPKSPIHIDGITKATISAQIANDLILGSSVQVAREKLFSSSPKKIYHPKKDLFEKYTWQELLDKKLVKNIKITKGEMEKFFEYTEYEEEISDDEKNELAFDLYIADISIPSVAKNLLSEDILQEIKDGVEKTEESILVFAKGEYNFISEDFIPGTSPDELEVKQDSFSLNIKDGNYDIEFLDNIPEFSQSMLLTVDKRYDFDPSSLWTLNVKIKRGKNSIFTPPVTRFVSEDIQYPKRYFDIPKEKVKAKKKISPEPKKDEKTKTPDIIENKQKTKDILIKTKAPQIIEIKQELSEEEKEELSQKLKEEIKEELSQELTRQIRQELIYELRRQIKQELEKKLEAESKPPFWLQSMYQQKEKLISLTLFLSILFILLYKYQTLLSKLKYKRVFILSITLFFIGWYAQGQLSIVTVIGVIKNIYNSNALTFLLYDPFGLIIWFFVFLSLFIWGRGTFCGWLCPYGVLQEFSYKLGRLLKLPIMKIPNKVNNTLAYLKYLILVILVASVFIMPDITKYLVEIEPFKTSITLMFDRELPYVLYALFWIVLGMFLFKGFCRYFCPLGAFLALSAKVRIFDWLPRRKECGNPCNNCFKKCNYQAIDKKDGHIKYSDCFQCLDCVEIYSDDKLCNILVKDAKKQKDINISKWSEKND